MSLWVIMTVTHIAKFHASTISALGTLGYKLSPLAKVGTIENLRKQYFMRYFLQNSSTKAFENFALYQVGIGKQHFWNNDKVILLCYISGVCFCKQLKYNHFPVCQCFWHWKMQRKYLFYLTKLDWTLVELQLTSSALWKTSLQITFFIGNHDQCALVHKCQRGKIFPTPSLFMKRIFVPISYTKDYIATQNLSYLRPGQNLILSHYNLTKVELS